MVSTEQSAPHSYELFLLLVRMTHLTCDLVQTSQMNFYCWILIELKFVRPFWMSKRLYKKSYRKKMKR